MSYLVPRLRTPQQSYGPSLGVKKSRKCDLATDLTLPKAIQEQQTQEERSTNYSDLPRTFLGLFAHVLERLSRDVAGTEPGPSPSGQAPKPVSWRRRPPRSGIGPGSAFQQHRFPGSGSFNERPRVGVLFSRGLYSWRKIGRRRFCVEKSVCYAAAAGGG
jgi:hypothetical protein